MERIDLVFHQSDKGGDNDSQSTSIDCGSLVAERFSAAGGHNNECVVAVESGEDGLML